MTTTKNAGTVVEGVDNDVLLAFIALMVITISTIIYFLSVNGRLTSTVGDSWQNLRTRLISISQDGLNVGSSSGAVQENVGSGRDAHESRDSLQNEETAVNEDKSGPSSETFQETCERPGTEKDQGMTRSNLPGRNQTESVDGGGLRNRTGLRTASSHAASNDNSGLQFSIRVKHHEVERIFVVEASMTVGELKRLTFPEEVAQGRRVRFIYSGRLLHDESASISFYGVSNYSVVHAQISDAPQQNAPLGQDDEDIELDMSRLFIPVLTLILCGCWYGLMTYRQLFDTTSTAILVIITAAYAFMVYVMFY